MEGFDGGVCVSSHSTFFNVFFSSLIDYLLLDYVNIREQRRQSSTTTTHTNTWTSNGGVETHLCLEFQDILPTPGMTSDAASGSQTLRRSRFFFILSFWFLLILSIDL